MAHILLIDDDATLRETFGALVGRLGHEFTWAGTLVDGRRALADGQTDVVLLDLRLPDGYGLSLMAEIKAAAGAPEVIIITGQDDPEGAALAIKSGAWDYIQKPLTPHRVSLPLTRALEYRAQKAARRPRTVLKREAIVGSGPAMDSSGVGALVRLQTALATRGKRLILANPLPAVADELRLRDLSGFFLLSWDIHPDMGQEALLLASDA